MPTPDFTPANPTAFAIPRAATAADILRAIDEWAEVSQSYHAQNLWDILSALRGPDNSGYNLKEETTTLIRGAALPNLSAVGGGQYRTGLTYEQAEQLQERMTSEYGPGTQSHFINHIRRAAGALVDERIVRPTPKVDPPAIEDEDSPGRPGAPGETLDGSPE